MPVHFTVNVSPAILVLPLGDGEPVPQAKLTLASVRAIFHPLSE